MLDEPVQPIEVSEVGKNTKQVFYGQILESAEPRINSKAQIGYNLVFSVGRNGALIQVWAFALRMRLLIYQSKLLRTHIWSSGPTRYLNKPPIKSTGSQTG